MMASGDRLRVNRTLAIPLSEVTLRASRSSGPGGQHANVTASRIEATFDVAASQSLSQEQRRRLMARVGPRVTAIAQDARGQTRNRQLALARLAERIDRGLAIPRTRHATKPTGASRQRRAETKRRAAQRKRDRRRPNTEE